MIPSKHAPRMTNITSHHIHHQYNKSARSPSPPPPSSSVLQCYSAVGAHLLQTGGDAAGERGASCVLAGEAEGVRGAARSEVTGQRQQ